jgi:hypothetical protein
LKGWRLDHAAILLAVGNEHPGTHADGCAMNPYEVTLPNVLARVAAWLRGLLRLYRRPLLIALLAGGVTGLGLGTSAGSTANTVTAASTP